MCASVLALNLSGGLTVPERLAGLSESVGSDNLKQDNPLFGVLALQGKVLVAPTKWHRKK